MIKSKIINNLHISACTADVTERNEKLCYESKFDSVTFKPINFEKISEFIKNFKLEWTSRLSW